MSNELKAMSLKGFTHRFLQTERCESVSVVRSSNSGLAAIMIRIGFGLSHAA